MWIESSHASTSMSGGGVGDRVLVGRDANAGHVAHVGVAGLLVQVADVVRGVAGRVGDAEALDVLAAAERVDALLGDRRDLAPQLPLSSP